MNDNKWKHGMVHFDLQELPPVLTASPGRKPISAILDTSVGKEIVLLVTETASKVQEFESRNITRFMLKVGLVNTSYGPVCFLLFYFSDSLTGTQVTYENTINPKDEQQLSVYKKLGKQKYWHVVIADDSGNVVNLFEFPNEYNLSDTITQVENACQNMQVSEFIAAKSEYESKFSINQLLSM